MGRFQDPTIGRAFVRAFYKPGIEPPRFDLMRLMAIPLTFLGTVWIAVAQWLDFVGRPLGSPWWAGALLIGGGCAVYGISKISAGPVTVDFDKGCGP